MQNLHKLKSVNFGHKYAQETLLERLNNHREHRKQQRTLYMFNKRNIHESDIMIAKENDSNAIRTKAEERMEMLKKWKEEKNLRLKKEKETAKPPFKVFHVPKPVVDQNLDEVYKKIKGKPIEQKPKSLSTTKEVIARRYTTRSQTLKSNIETPIENDKIFATKKTSHKTKIESGKITKDSSTTKPKTAIKNQNVKENNKKIKQNEPPTRQLRSKKEHVDISCNLGTNKMLLRKSKLEKDVDGLATKIENLKTNNSNVNKKDESADTTKTEKTTHNSSLSPEYPISQEEDTSDSSPNYSTPNKNTTPIAYVSPFVTISRGKTSARKEYEMRKSREDLSKSLTLTDANECTSPKAGAAYFYQVLTEQVERINVLCEKWEKIKKDEEPPEEACDSINSAVGQSQLLLNKKFKQFRVLIDQCANTAKEDLLVTCEDLHGYWDMMHREIVDIDRRYGELEKLKQNNWTEVLPVADKFVQKKKKINKKKVVAKSRLADIIKAARQQNKENIQESEAVLSNDEVFSTPSSALNEPAKNLRSSTRRKSESYNSPGLKMMAVSLSAKRLSTVTKQTPNKSILKSGKSATKSTKRKQVFFGNDFDIDKVLSENGQIKDTSFSLINWDTPETNVRRRSARLVAKSKLCF